VPGRVAVGSRSGARLSIAALARVGASFSPTTPRSEASCTATAASAMPAAPMATSFFGLEDAAAGAFTDETMAVTA